MWVSQVQLTNVRGFVDAKINFSKKINILIGSNNCGKTTLLNSVFMLQGTPLNVQDIRVRSDTGQISMWLQDIEKKFGIKLSSDQYLLFHLAGRRTIRSEVNNHGQFKILQSREPNNFIYPYLSKRKAASFSHDINSNAAYSVTGTYSNLYAKIDNLLDPQRPAHDDYIKACDDILGFRVSTVPSDQGKEAVFLINNFENIPLIRMGEGVPNLLGLIVDLCVAENKLFLIEEPENDIHPRALKNLLQLIVKKSEKNQFIITTHSNIVTKYLGAQDDSKIISVSMEFGEDRIPVSKADYVETQEERIKVLEDLGYDLFDYDLWGAWLFLEESSAERIIREFLIPWFVPDLAATLRTFSASGVDKIDTKFDDFNHLFVFLHLQENYKNKAWVVVDGGEMEQEIIDRLKSAYTKSGWDEEHFLQLSEHDFEVYYPEFFQESVSDILKIQDKKKKRAAKKDLLIELIDWCNEDPDRGRSAFQESAGEIIDLLRNIASKLSTDREF